MAQVVEIPMTEKEFDKVMSLRPAVYYPVKPKYFEALRAAKPIFVVTLNWGNFNFSNCGLSGLSGTSAYCNVLSFGNPLDPILVGSFISENTTPAMPNNFMPNYSAGFGKRYQLAMSLEPQWIKDCPSLDERILLRTLADKINAGAGVSMYILSDPVLRQELKNDKRAVFGNVAKFVKFLEDEGIGKVFKLPPVINNSHIGDGGMHAVQVFGWVPPKFQDRVFEPGRLLNPRAPEVPTCWPADDPRIKFIKEQSNDFYLTYSEIFGKKQS